MDYLDIGLVSDLFTSLSATVAAASVVTLVYTAFRRRVVSFRPSLESDINITPEDIKSIDSGDSTKKSPFEITALANYYSQALNRANTSFWFSLIFASIGFGVIIVAFMGHQPNDLAGTAIKIASGTIIDAVASLFFIQSTNAQKSMEDFFSKLRLDRLNAEAREMIDQIENAERRDQLRSQLILKYSGIEKLLVGTES